MNLPAVLSLAATVVAAVAALAVVVPTRRASRPARVEGARHRFAAVQRELRSHQVALGRQAVKEAPAEWRAADVPLLSGPGWLFDQPRDLSELRLRLTSTQYASPDADWRMLRGLSVAGPVSYSDAIRLANPDSPYFNGTIYRLRGVTTEPDSGLKLEFEPGKYFDYLDTGEVLAYEAQLNRKARRIRKRFVNPFDLSNRIASLGVLTLTIIRTATEPRFLMHQRSGQFVVGDALYHVVPAGEFAPSDISLAAIRNDFDLWRNVMREYAEELLGIPDAQGQGGRRISYETESPYKELAEARRSSELKVWALGLALDPLTYKPELLTVVVIGAGAYRRIFGNAVASTAEGVLVTDIPFDKQNVYDYVTNDTVRLGAQACLLLAWRHRAAMGLQ